MLAAKEIMTKDVITVRPETPVYEAMQLLVGSKITGVPVVDEEMRLVGVLTEKDVLRIYYDPQSAKEKTVADFMTKPAVHFDEDERLYEICNCLMESGFRRVPVTSGGKVVGIISRPDIIEYVLKLGKRG